MINHLIRIAARAKRYQRRGYTLVGMIVSIISHSAIWWGLLPYVKKVFDNDATAFTAVFIPSFLGACLIYGWWDVHHGTYMYDEELLDAASPSRQDIFYCFKKLAEAIEHGEGSERTKKALQEVHRVSGHWVSNRNEELVPRKESGGSD